MTRDALLVRAAVNGHVVQRLGGSIIITYFFIYKDLENCYR
jgi:hypothetical protein